MDKIRAVSMSATEMVAHARLSMASWVLPGQPSGDPHENDRGQGLAEYSLILGGIAVVAIVSLVALGGTISDMFWDPISDDFGEVLCNILGICPPPPA